LDLVLIFIESDTKSLSITQREKWLPKEIEVARHGHVALQGLAGRQIQTVRFMWRKRDDWPLLNFKMLRIEQEN
jgi:hypothetical protein